MFRRFILLLITLCVGWQALAYGGTGVMFTDDEVQLHELLHFQGAAHHHHGLDDDLHQDESISSLLHVVADNGIFSPALIVGSLSLAFSPTGNEPPAESLQAWPFPTLDGLERPPRLPA